MIIDKPSQASFHLPNIKETMLDNKAVAPIATHKMFPRAYTIDSFIFALGGSGRLFIPNLKYSRLVHSHGLNRSVGRHDCRPLS